MPYVPSKKTDGESNDRVRIDEVVEKVALSIVEKTKGNAKELATSYRETMIAVGYELSGLELGGTSSNELANTIFDVAKKYNYVGAWFGELNYSITRLIQVVPRVAKENGFYQSELRYWLYAITAGVLKVVSDEFSSKEVATCEEYIKLALTGVFIDILHEYKRRVNTSYEAAQIIKSGDCYTTPYLTQLTEIVNEEGKVVGHMEIMLKREDYNGKDVSGKITIRE